MKLIAGIQDTRINGEDFALTPYLHLVWASNSDAKIRGLGLCWGYFAVFVGIGLNIPTNYPRFLKYTNKEDKP